MEQQPNSYWRFKGEREWHPGWIISVMPGLVSVEHTDRIAPSSIYAEDEIDVRTIFHVVPEVKP